MSTSKVGRIRPGCLRLAWALCSLLLVVPATAQERGEGGTDVGNAHILGVVNDRESESPLGTVQVVLAEENGEEVWSGITDTRGRFRISLIPPGTYQLTFRRLAYRTTTETVAVESQAEVNVVAHLAPEALEMEPLVVTSSRRSALQRVGFYDRERRWDGTFFHREDIEDQDALSVPELVRMVPSFQLIGRPPDEYTIVSTRGGQGLLPGQPTCGPAVFLDGVPMEGQPWDLVRPDDLAAMEVYHGMMTPAEFYTRGKCGAIVMWTHQGEPRPGEPEPTGLGSRRFVAGAAALVIAAGLQVLF